MTGAEGVRAELREADRPLAHITAGPAARDQAYRDGTELTALCGYVWVPTLNPDDYETCKPCVYELARIASENRGESTR